MILSRLVPVLLLAPGAVACASAASPTRAPTPVPARVAVGEDPASRMPGGGLEPGEHQVVVDGVRLWYEVAGPPDAAARPVVFLHGGPGQGSHHFQALAGPALEPSLRMVYWDQRGSGRSERPWTEEYSIERLVQDLEGLRRALGVERVDLIAHSFGAVLGLEYAARYPDRVAHLVVVSGLWSIPVQGPLRCRATNARFPEVAREVLGDSAAQAAFAAGTCDWYWQLGGERRESLDEALMFPDSTVAEALERDTEESGLRNTGELGAALVRQGLMEYAFTGFRRATAPVLVIAGGRDGAAVPAGLRELADRLPDARFVVYEDAGHFVYLDDTQRFVRDVVEFLEN